MRWKLARRRVAVATASGPSLRRRRSRTKTERRSLRSQSRTLNAEPEDTVRVQYIPETVKAQLREEIKQEVLDQAREEHWAAPRSFPEWVSRVHPFADLRVRFEGDYFPAGNDNTGAFPNFNAINTGPPFDITGTTFSPQLNVDQDRDTVPAPPAVRRGRGSRG